MMTFNAAEILNDWRVRLETFENLLKNENEISVIGKHNCVVLVNGVYTAGCDENGVVMLVKAGENPERFSPKAAKEISEMRFTVDPNNPVKVRLMTPARYYEYRVEELREAIELFEKVVAESKK